MTQSQKLEALIHKAVDGGFDKGVAASWIRQLITDDPETTRRFAPMLIFNHDFAQALFGEEELGIANTEGFDNGAAQMFSRIIKPGWKRQIQNMVIADDPIDYAYNSVFGEA